MKRPLLILVMLCVSALHAHSQTFQKPADGKSLIYFVRISGTGALINFRYFDGEKYLGKMNGVHYFTYECEPGQHIFWVAAENRDFVTADLKPNATYLVEVRPTMGAFKAAVQVRPIGPNDVKTLKRVNKILAKRQPTELTGKDDDMAFFIKNGMERYEKIKAQVPSINPDWTF